jgi:hypothetical protein
MTPYIIKISINLIKKQLKTQTIGKMNHILKDKLGEFFETFDKNRNGELDRY